jgi:hypothetical protein
MSTTASARYAASITLTLILTLCLGCDGGMPPWNCKNPCPGNLRRDFFCNCYDPTEYKTKPPGIGGSQTELASACTCQLADGSYESHFRLRPANFESLNGHDVVVNAATCTDLTVCPDLDPRPGLEYLHQEYRTGRFRQRVESTTIYTGILRPGQHWSIVGPIVGSAASIPSDTGFRLASVATPSQTEQNLPSLQCQEHCTPGDEFCLRYSLPSKYGTPMRALAARILQDFHSSIAKTELMSLFQEASDECSRSDIDIVNQTITNDGKECIMTALLNPNSGLAIRILIPAHLSGIITSIAPPTLTFAAPEFAPVVAFNNEDFEFSFGGEIRSAWIASDNITIETYNGCSKVSF